MVAYIVSNFLFICRCFCFGFSWSISLCPSSFFRCEPCSRCLCPGSWVVWILCIDCWIQLWFFSCVGFSFSFFPLSHIPFSLCTTSTTCTNYLPYSEEFKKCQSVGLGYPKMANKWLGIYFYYLYLEIYIVHGGVPGWCHIVEVVARMTRLR